MECKVLKFDLVDYYWGTLDTKIRSSIENHLCNCQECMRDFVLVKRDFEVERDDQSIPSLNVKMALREEVERTFKKSQWSALFNFASKPFPMYQLAPTSLIIALVIAVFLHFSFLATPKRAEDVQNPQSEKSKELTSIDSSQSSAENVNFL